jgi:mannose-6-phosphate isomerase-like protein (cupin superfamily)
MHTTLADLLARLPGPPSAEWPAGERYVEAFQHGTMSFGLYSPRGHDPQTPHEQDELYVIHAGTGEFVNGAERRRFAPGEVLFVAAGVEHRFLDFSPDFAAWVVFWGPRGGEAP